MKRKHISLESPQTENKMYSQNIDLFYAVKTTIAHFFSVTVKGILKIPNYQKIMAFLKWGAPLNQ